MNFGSLTLLSDILDAGSLSSAARKLNLSRATISYHLTHLERELGVQLVRRTTRRIEPTEIGLRLAQHGRTIQRELEAAQEFVETRGRTLTGRIRLSVPSGYGQMVMAQWLIDFKRAYPGIVLDVRFENRIVDLLQEEVDISVRVVSEPPPNVVARDLGPVRYVACASRQYAEGSRIPQTLDDLRIVPVITSGVVGRQLRIAGTLAGDRKEVLLEPVLISEHFPFLRKAILAGLGIGVVPDYVIGDRLEAGDVVRVLEDWTLSIFGNSMFLMYMPNRRHTLATSTFIEFVLARANSGRNG